MMDYLDALINRHLKAAPQIIPRLPSIYESEVSHGGWEDAAPDNGSEMQETVLAEPIVPVKENARERVEPTDFEPSPIPITPVAAPAEPMQENGVPSRAAPAAEEKPAVETVPHEPASSRSPQAKTLDAGFSKSLADKKITPVIGEVHHKREAEHKEPMSPHREETSEDRPFVNKPRAGNHKDSEKADPKEPVIPLCNTEKRSYAEPNKASAADRIAPLTVKVRHVHRDERVKQGASHPEVQADDRPFLKKDPGEPVPTPFRQERVEIEDLHSVRERRTPSFPDKDEGLKKPSAALITPVTPSVAGSERSTSQPEPVINVTIGRIEVRATVPPQKQSPRTENRPPVMGLDEYLRRRSGGHDR